MTAIPKSAVSAVLTEGRAVFKTHAGTENPQNTIIALNFPPRKPKAEAAETAAAPKVAATVKTETPKAEA